MPVLLFACSISGQFWANQLSSSSAVVILAEDTSSQQVLSALSTLPPISISSITEDHDAVSDGIHRIAHKTTSADHLYHSICTSLKSPTAKVEVDSVVLSTQVNIPLSSSTDTSYVR